MRILAVCGSLQSQSGNLTLLEVATATAPAGVGVVVFDGVRDLPLFNPDLEANGDAPPPAVVEWRRVLGESDALLIATPEYGHSLPGALKNAIDWVIGSGEAGRKVVGITAAVPSLERGRRGLGALRDTLGAVCATVVGGEPIARGASFESEVASLVSKVVATVESATLRESGERSDNSR